MINELKWFLAGITGVMFVCDLVQSFLYLPAADRAEGADHMPHWAYYVAFTAFFGAMIFALFAPTLPLMWVAVELTTLVSAPLIAYHRSKGALEAMWKYLLICSIGIGLALYGTMLVLHAETTGNAMWYKVGFVFVLAGYGTKMGLAPFHTWLPDAHSEAPAPVSALLSGALLNCSFFAIARFRAIMPAAVGPFCDRTMLALGALSVLTAAVFMVRQTDFKRLLAYSSVEHMGLVAILFALIGLNSLSDPVSGLSSFPTLQLPNFSTFQLSNFSTSQLLLLSLFLHIAAHSLTKTMMFLTAGNLLLAFGTRAIAAVQGLYSTMKGHAAIWIVGTLFICGMPPSLLFLSELGLVVSAPAWLSAVVLVLLFAVFAAMTKLALGMTMGRSANAPAPLPARFIVVPAALLLALALIGAFGAVLVLGA